MTNQQQLNQMSKEELIVLVAQLEQQNQKLAQQNTKLVLLCKEKDRSLYQSELVIRKYRTRLVRWFEDMVYDPLENPDVQILEGLQQNNPQVKLDPEVKKE